VVSHRENSNPCSRSRLNKDFFRKHGRNVTCQSVEAIYVDAELFASINEYFLKRLILGQKRLNIPNLNNEIFEMVSYL